MASLWPTRCAPASRLVSTRPFVDYLTKRQFIDYLETYSARAGVEPRFNQFVTSARYDAAAGLWRVRAEDASDAAAATEYVGRWLVVATGENAERIVPEFDGAEDFGGPVSHVSEYKSGEAYRRAPPPKTA